MPPDESRNEGTPSLSEVPNAGAQPFGSFLAFEKGTRRKGETASRRTRSNGYVPPPTRKTGRLSGRQVPLRNPTKLAESPDYPPQSTETMVPFTPNR